MNIKIPAPQGSKIAYISLVDIERVENCSLTFFDSSAHNLYVVEKATKGEEFFSLYSYKRKEDMLTAFNLINGLLKKKPAETIILEMEPMKG
ncbi:hypothetical protein [Pontibacter fetidus]|uniref:Uncharacterized protein n=1 Tax=Pontibacter fetidus TaxID=2700082 RepID=A0A6B2H4B4_9BACT|nr:hypothetical protein [Pontibacter fetidus]NDK55157.1 hypothetical protein [Pontibacter fetidus]